MSLICFYFFIRIDTSFFSCYFYRDILPYLCYEESSRAVDMWPEMFLIGDLECPRIFRSDTLEYSLILDEIHTAGRVDHFSSDLKCDDRSIDELLLESSDSLDIFYMPVFGRVSSLK